VTDQAALSAQKRRILEALKRADSLTTAELADRLEVTAVATRDHIEDLHASGLVERLEDAPRGRGRPAHRWAITPLADSLFPDRHADLTVALITSIRSTLGDDALERVIEARTRTQRAVYQQAIPDDRPLGQKVKALARLRTGEGYEAEARRDSSGAWLLIEHHCPICDAATACLTLCRDELTVFQQVLGPDARVERTQHLLGGDRRCTYRITPTVRR
jgi:predicted ArsR family transcriptional regulator